MQFDKDPFNRIKIILLFPKEQFQSNFFCEDREKILVKMARLNFCFGYKQIRMNLLYVNETPCITVSMCIPCNYKSELASYLILLLFKIKYSFVSIVIEKS